MARKKLTFEDGYNQALKDYERFDHNLEYLWGKPVTSVAFFYHNPKKPNKKTDWGEEIEHSKNDFKTIYTKYDQGYDKALEDLEAEKNEHKNEP